MDGERGTMANGRDYRKRQEILAELGFIEEVQKDQ